MKTIAQQLNITEFPFKIKNRDGNEVYYENSFNQWIKREFDIKGNTIYYEDSNGYIRDNRPKPCENKVVEVDGIKYKLTAV